MSNVKKSIVLTVILSLLLAFYVSAETVIPFEGEGTEESPYLIGTAEEMYRFAEIVNGGYSFEGEYLKLTDDLLLFDAKGSTAELKTTWTPIGIDYDCSFNGSFDGDGHEIKGVYIYSDKGIQGLFGWMTDGEIKNLILSESVISGNGTYVAGIVACHSSSDEEDHNKAIILNCVNNAVVINKGDYTGGVAGSGMLIKNCINNGNVTGSKIYTSGVAASACRIENCVNNGDVTGIENVAGVCYTTYCERTHNYERGVFGCTNNGTVRYEEDGYSITDPSWSEKIEDCVNNGDVIHVLPEVHVHSYTAEEIPPTCTWQGYTSHVCDCGDVYYDNYVPALPHTPVDIGLKAPTCTIPGWKDGTKCSVCNKILSSAGSITETGHSAEWVTVTEAQIGIDGLQQLKCTVCGVVLEEKVIPATKKGDINGDGKITAADARLILRYSARLDNGWDDADIISIADFDNDGKLTAKDARQCLRYAAGLDDYFKDFGVNIK